MEFLSVFASVDKDQDLVIYEADLDNYAAEMKYEKVFTQKWLRLFDLDKDGKISFSEFCETLGLDEKIYEEKLREVRKNIALRQQPQQSSDADRANRRISRLPKQPVTNPPPVQPQQAKKSLIPVKVDDSSNHTDIQEEVVQPQASQKVRSGYRKTNNDNSLDEVVIELNEDDLLRSIEVEFSDMDPKELDEVKATYAKLASENKSENTSEFDLQLMHTLDKKLGKSWQCQSNPELSYKEVNYKEGSMAVLATKQPRRVMIWRPEQAGGTCCCCS